MQVTKQTDVLTDLAAPYDAEVEVDVVLSKLVALGGEDVLAHHLRSAYRRTVQTGCPDGMATWESCV